MFDKTAILNDFSRAAHEYDAHATLQRDVRRHCLQIAKAHWKKGARILDVGCGTGAFFREASGWHITGVDFSPGMCEQARRKNNQIINADAHHLPIASESFDGVFSSLMLQWASDSTLAMSEMARVLKPGAHAVVSTLAAGTLAELADAFSAIDRHPHVSDFPRVSRWIAHAKAAGFSAVLAKQLPTVEYYPNALELMRGLKIIGAANKQQNRRRSLMTVRQLAKIEQAYVRTPEGVPATWQVLYLLLRRGA